MQHATMLLTHEWALLAKRFIYRAPLKMIIMKKRMHPSANAQDEIVMIFADKNFKEIAEEIANDTQTLANFMHVF